MGLIVDPNYLNTETDSYVTLAEAELILGARPYATSWTNLSTSPSASAWVVDGALLAGATTVNIKDGTGSFTDGNTVRINGTNYSISNVTVSSFDIAPALAADVADETSIRRLTYNDREKMLAWASRSLDRQVSWKGSSIHNDQPMRWPRSNVTNCDGKIYCYDCFPQDLKVLVCEYALTLAQRDLSALPSILGLGIKRAKVDVLEVEADNTLQAEMATPYIKDLLGCMGVWKGSTNASSKVMTLYRS